MISHFSSGVLPGSPSTFNVVFTLTEFIDSRKQVHGAATFVYLDDIVLSFPPVNRDIPLVLLDDAGVPPKLCQHVLALYRSLMYRVLHMSILPTTRTSK
jgi:hypothetical protein